MHSEKEDDGEENDFREGDEPSAAKKPRVVWSVELHRKFVSAVNQLGIDSKNCQPSLLLYVVVLIYCSNSFFVLSFILLLLQKLYQKEFLTL